MTAHNQLTINQRRDMVNNYVEGRFLEAARHSDISAKQLADIYCVDTKTARAAIRRMVRKGHLFAKRPGYYGVSK